MDMVPNLGMIILVVWVRMCRAVGLTRPSFTWRRFPRAKRLPSRQGELMAAKPSTAAERARARMSPKELADWKKKKKALARKAAYKAGTPPVKKKGKKD